MATKKSKAKPRKAPAKSEKPLTDNAFFVSINEPDMIRKNFLECSRDLIHTLKRHESFMHLRTEKQKLMDDLRKQVNQISREIEKIRTTLPKVGLRENKSMFEKEAQVETVEVVEQVEKKTPAPKKQTVKTELEILENELAGIEDKLKNLTSNMG